MMKLARILLPLFIICFAVLSACQRQEPFSEVPELSFVGFNDTSYVADSVVHLTLGFRDGDGDLGGDSQSVFLTYVEKQDGQLVEYPATDVEFSYSFPDITPTGRNKSIEGEMIVLLSSVFYYDFTSPYDTFRYRTYIIDRAGNKSNVVETPDLIKR